MRELQNAVERAVVLAPGPRLEAADLPRDLRDDPIDAPADGVPEDLPLRMAFRDER